MFLQVVVQLVVNQTFEDLRNHWQHTEIGLKLVTASLSPPFGTGVTCADFHSFGVSPLVKLALKREVRLWLIAG